VSKFNIEKFKPEDWHHPHWYEQKGNVENMISKKFAEPFKDGHSYRMAYIDEKTGEEVHVHKCGVFRRFSYNAYVDEVVRICKEFAKKYEEQFK